MLHEVYSTRPYQEFQVFELALPMNDPTKRLMRIENVSLVGTTKHALEYPSHPVK